MSKMDALERAERDAARARNDRDEQSRLAEAMRDQRDEARAEAARLQALIDTPELHDFAKALPLEAVHQRKRWGSDHDSGKEPEDWLWLLGWLAGKAVRAARDGDREKALHHTISSAAVLANWHAAILGVDTSMRPGIIPPEEIAA